MKIRYFYFSMENIFPIRSNVCSNVFTIFENIDFDYVYQNQISDKCSKQKKQHTIDKNIETWVKHIQNEINHNHACIILNIQPYDLYCKFIKLLRESVISFNKMIWIINLVTFNQIKLKRMPEHWGELKGYFWDMHSPHVHFHSTAMFSCNDSNFPNLQYVKKVEKELMFHETCYFDPAHDLQDIYHCFLIHINRLISSNPLNHSNVIYACVEQNSSKNCYNDFLEMIKPIDNYQHNFHVRTSLYGSNNAQIPLCKLIPKINQLVCFIECGVNMDDEVHPILDHEIKKEHNHNIHIICMFDVVQTVSSIVQYFDNLKFKNNNYSLENIKIHVHCTFLKSHTIDYLYNRIMGEYSDQFIFTRCENDMFDSRYDITEKHFEPLCQILKQLRLHNCEEYIPSLRYWDFLLKMSFVNPNNIHDTTTKSFTLLQYDNYKWENKAKIIGNNVMSFKYVTISTTTQHEPEQKLQ